MNAPAVTSEVGEEVLERKRFSGAEWDRMLAAGLFDEDERLELIDGEVVVMSPIGGDPHEVVAVLLDAALGRALAPGHHIREEKGLNVGEDRFYPDFVVVRGEPERYLRKKPSVADAALVVEIADSTPARDLVIKAQRYARAGLAEYWVVVIPEQVVVVHREPARLGRGKATYADVRRVAKGSLSAGPLRRAIKLSAFLRGP